MKRLAIKKLIVISQSESRSLEVPFENGLNIILGGNKTGKSSIIKSIFTTLGCECKRIETDWKKLISAYLLFFKYGEKQFCVVRQGKKFQIFENNEDSYSCIIETETFHEYSNCLMDILEIKMPCISRDFVQIIDRTGSETPRLVYMYQSALYLYNLYRTNSPFNFYVVDTPNQQGQDAENLGSIFKSLELFLSDEGQVIVGTERETGLEGKASNVIKLTEKRRCLNTINYSKHLELLEELQKTAISWVAFNHKAKNEK